jgi:hypothetical protein
MRRDVRRATQSPRGSGAVGAGAEREKEAERTPLSDADLVDLLRRSKRTYAQLFLDARTNGTELEPGRKATVEDARMWARRAIIELHVKGEPVDDPETVRWMLIQRHGSPAMAED